MKLGKVKQNKVMILLKTFRIADIGFETRKKFVYSLD